MKFIGFHTRSGIIVMTILLAILLSQVVSCKFGPIPPPPNDPVPTDSADAPPDSPEGNRDSMDGDTDTVEDEDVPPPEET